MRREKKNVDRCQQQRCDKGGEPLRPSPRWRGGDQDPAGQYDHARKGEEAL